MVLGGDGFNTRGRMMLEPLCWLSGFVVGVIIALVLIHYWTKKALGKAAGEFLRLVLGRRRP